MERETDIAVVTHGVVVRTLLLRVYLVNSQATRRHNHDGHEQGYEKELGMLTHTISNNVSKVR